MAFLSGSQVNPALGRTDFTPFLQGSVQGSQMAAQGAAAIGQGIAGLGAGIAQGMERYKQNKELGKKQEGIIKAADKLSAGFEAVASQMRPELSQAISNLRTTISDPNLSVSERAAAADYFMQQAPNLLNAGLKLMEQQSAEADAKRRRDAEMAKMQAAAPGFASPQEAVASVANQPVPAGYTVGYKAIDGGRYVPELVAAKDREDKGGFDTPDAALAAAQKLPVPEGQAPSFRVGAGGKYYPELVTKPVQQVANPEEDQRVKIFGDVMRADIESGKIAQRIAPNIGRLTSMLEGGLETGKLAQFKANARGVLKAIGVEVDDKKLADAQEAQAYLGQSILEYFQQTKGAISNKENELFASFGPAMEKDPEANKRLIAAIRARLKLDRDIAKAVEDGNAAGKSFRDIQTERRKLIEQYDSSLPAVTINRADLFKNADAIIGR